MIGLVLVTHGRLAQEMLAAMEHVVGEQKQVRVVCMEADDDMEQRRGEIREALEEVDTGSGVLLLTDMFGGTPSNLAISFLERSGVEVLAGVNLPMLIKISSARGTKTLQETARLAQQAGRKYISIASQVLAGDPKGR